MAAAQYWVDVLWAAVGGACVVMAGVHLALSRHQRDRASLVFALCAMVVGAISATQLLMMHASPPDGHGHLQRWSQTLSSLLFMGLSVHAWLRFPASRGGLCVAACVTQLAALALSLSEVTEAATWMALASALVLVAQLVDTVIGTRRRHSAAEATQAARLCGAVAVFVLASAMWPAWAGEWPARVDAIVVPAFLCVLVAVGLDLAGTVGQAAQSFASVARRELRFEPGSGSCCDHSKATSLLCCGEGSQSSGEQQWRICGYSSPRRLLIDRIRAAPRTGSKAMRCPGESCGRHLAVYCA